MTKEKRDRVRKVLGLAAQIVLVMLALWKVASSSAEEKQTGINFDRNIGATVARIDSNQAGLMKWRSGHEVEHVNIDNNNVLVVGYLKLIMKDLKIDYPEGIIDRERY